MLKVIDIYESQTLERGISVYLNNQAVMAINQINKDWMMVITHNGVYPLEMVYVRADKKLRLGQIAFKNDAKFS
jgi:hypothetical protein